MALETFGFIDDLDPSSPDGTAEYVSQGDDHIKGIKLTLKNTFPNLTGAVTATQNELNQLFGTTISDYAKTMLDDTDAATARATLGIGVASTTLTFSSVAPGADGTAQNWAHGLGTDDVDFGITVEHDNAAVSYTTKAAAAIGANGAWAMFGDGSGLPADPNVPANAPATGNIRVNVRNLAGSTSTIRVHIWARTRS